MTARGRRLAVVVAALLGATVTSSFVVAASPSTVVDGYRVDVRVLGAGEVIEADRRCSHRSACRWSRGTGLFGHSIRFDALDTVAGWRFSRWSGCPRPLGRTCRVSLPGLWGSGTLSLTAVYQRTGLAIAGGPRGGAVVPSHDAWFTFAAAGPVDGAIAYRCAIDRRPFVPCGSAGSVAYTLADGWHRFRVEGHDRWGRIGSASRVWTIDTRAPVATVTAAPPPADNHTTVRFRFSAADASGVRWQCREFASGATRLPPFLHCRSGIRYRVAAGAQTFQVRAIDLAGNVSDVATHRWDVDLTPPEVVIAAAPRSETSSPSARFAFSTGDAITVRCALDGAWAPCPSAGSASYRGLTTGPHSFAVRAWDAAGNEATAERTWRIGGVASKPRGDRSAGHPATPAARGLILLRAGQQARPYQGSLPFVGAHGSCRGQQAPQLATGDLVTEAGGGRHGEGGIGHAVQPLRTGLQPVCKWPTRVFSGTRTGVASR